jgi:hypothetical protein
MTRRNAVLILAANPKDTPGLRLDQEVREIQSGLRRLGAPFFEIRQDWAVRARDVRRALLEHRPRIVHFCGHGTGEDGLVLEDDAGESRVVSTSAIAGLFALFKEHVQCVVLNACYSEAQAKAIALNVDCVIGMSRAISDSAAIEFSIGFYDAVAAGRDFSEAFRFGCNAIELAGLPGTAIPVLLRRQEGGPFPTISHSHYLGHGFERTRSSDRNLVLRTLQQLEDEGWTTNQIMRRLEQLDYDTIAGLDEESEGTAGEWEELAISNPDGYALLLDSRNEIVGYWHFEALPDEMFARAMSGTLEDGEITLDRVALLCAPGLLKIYFIIFAVEKRFRGFRANRLLLEAFLQRLEDLATGGIYVSNICANAFTPEGVGLCKSLGMQYVGAHCRQGLMYSIDLADSELLNRERPDLSSKLRLIRRSRVVSLVESRSD